MQPQGLCHFWISEELQVRKHHSKYPRFGQRLSVLHKVMK